MTLLKAIGTVLVGFASGMLSGAVGVGGAVVSTPGIRALGAPPLIAVGSTLPAAIPSAATGSINYARARLIEYRVAIVCALAGSAAAVAGAYTSSLVNGHILMLVTAGLVAENAIRMARDARRMTRHRETSPPESDTVLAPELVDEAKSEGPADDQAPRRSDPLTAVIGLVAGFVSGLLGIGGGVILIPGFYRVLRLPVKKVVATSLLVVAILAVPGTLTHWHLGHIDWAFALLLAVGVIPGAYVGSRFTVRTDEIKLRIVIAVVLGVVAVLYAAGEIRALLTN